VNNNKITLFSYIVGVAIVLALIFFWTQLLIILHLIIHYFWQFLFLTTILVGIVLEYRSTRQNLK
jgi:hypothetical protein